MNGIAHLSILIRLNAIKSQEEDLAMLEKPLKFIRIEIQSHIRKIILSV